MSDITATWLLKQLSWYLIALIAVFSFSSVKFLEQILASTTAFESLVSDSAVQINHSTTIHRLNWAFRLSCTAVLLTILGALWTIGSRLHSTAAKHRFILEAGTFRTSCSVLPVSRLAVNVVHALAILSTVWFGALLCYVSTLFCAFHATERLADNAMSLQLTAQVDQTFFQDTRAWLEASDGQINGIVRNVNEYCSRLQCGTTITDSMASLGNFQAEVKELEISFASVSAVACPTVACINMELLNFWGTSATGCVCTPDAVESLHNDALQGYESCRVAIMWAVAAFVALALLQSSSAMHLKSLVKDHHWMHRLSTLADELATKGISPPNSTYSLLNEGSLSHYQIRHPPDFPVDPGQGMPEYKVASHGVGSHGLGKAVRPHTCAPHKPTGMLARQSLDAENPDEETLKAVGGTGGGWGNIWDGPDAHGMDGQQVESVPVPPARV